MTAVIPQIIESENPNVTSSLLGQRGVLFQAGLLAGLGSRAIGAEAEIQTASVSGAMLDNRLDRTCVDLGRPLLFSITSRARRQLRVHAHTNDRDLIPNATRWAGFRFNPDGSTGHVETILFTRESPDVWCRVLHHAHKVGCKQQVKDYQARVGPFGKIFGLVYSIDETEPFLQIKWMIDRVANPSRILQTCGVPNAWPSACKLLSQLLGRPVSAYTRPWSIAVTFGIDWLQVQLGTSAWAFRPESIDKHRRLARIVRELGGDGSFAEAIYKLLLLNRSQAGARVGRAIELTVSNDGVEALEAYAVCDLICR